MSPFSSLLAGNFKVVLLLDSYSLPYPKASNQSLLLKRSVGGVEKWGIKMMAVWEILVSNPLSPSCPGIYSVFKSVINVN